MRKIPYPRLIGILVLIIACRGHAGGGEMTLDKLPYPSAVALFPSDGGKWVYKSFPTLLPLYIFDAELAGTSACDKVCTAVWPIVRADGTDKPLGLWTIVKRADGRLQWAFRNKPVYTYFEDTPDEAKGVGKDMYWYLDERGITYLRSVGVSLPEQAERERGNEDQAKKISVLLPTLN